MLEPRKKGDDGILLEFKVQDTEEKKELADTVREALNSNFRIRNKLLRINIAPLIGAHAHPWRIADIQQVILLRFHLLTAFLTPKRILIIHLIGINIYGLPFSASAAHIRYCIVS